MKSWLRFAAFATIATFASASAQDRPGPPVPPSAGSAPASQPGSAPAKPPSPHGLGPLRVELSAVLEGRYRYFDQDQTQPTRENELRMQFRVAGADVLRVVRHGNVLLDEVTDDAGQSLFDPATITAEQRTTARLSSTPPERLAESGLLMVGQCKASSRTAQKLRTVRGSVKLVLSSAYQEVTIVNPQQYVGKAIDIPRLKELGVEATVLAPETFTPPADPKTSYTLLYTVGADRVRGASFYDGWMNVVRSRPTPVQTPDGKEAQQYRLMGGAIDEKSQIVIQIFPDAREETVRFELKDVQLP